MTGFGARRWGKKYREINSETHNIFDRCGFSTPDVG